MRIEFSLNTNKFKWRSEAGNGFLKNYLITHRHQYKTFENVKTYKILLSAFFPRFHRIRFMTTLRTTQCGSWFRSKAINQSDFIKRKCWISLGDHLEPCWDSNLFERLPCTWGWRAYSHFLRRCADLVSSNSRERQWWFEEWVLRSDLMWKSGRYMNDARS